MPPQDDAPKFKIFTAALKATEVEGRKRLACTASSSVEDLHGDTMTDDCVRDMAKQAKDKNMTIFLNHRYAVPEDVMGKTIDTRSVSRAHEKDGTAIWDFDLDLEVNETNPRALNTWAAIKEAGVKLGVSIGANIEEWEFKDTEKGWWGGLIIKKVNLLEASVVGIPANPRSWVTNAVKALKSFHSVDDTNSDIGDGDAAGPLEGDGVVRHGVEVPEGSTATLTVNADGSSQVTIEKTETEATTITTDLVVYKGDAEESDDAPDGETAESEEEDEATKAEEPTSPVDLEAAKAAASGLDTESGDSSLTKSILLALIASYEKVVGERDAALAKVKDQDALLHEAAEIISIAVNTPLGRKTSFANPAKSFKARFGGIYDAEFLDIIERD